MIKEFTREDALRYCERTLIALGEPEYHARRQAHLPVEWAEKFITSNHWCTSLREACEIALSGAGDPWRVRDKARREREQLRNRIDGRCGQLGVIPSRRDLMLRLAVRKGFAKQYSTGPVCQMVGDLVAWFRARWNERNGWPNTIYRAMTWERRDLIRIGAVSRGVPSIDEFEPEWQKERTMIGLR